MRSRLGSFVVLALTVALLAGCVPQSRADLERYVDELGEHEAVQSIELGVSTPLPFSVQGSVTVTLMPEVSAAQIDDLLRVACDRDVNASVHFELQLELAPGAVLSHDVGSRCYPERTAWTAALPVLRESAAALGDVAWSVLELDDGEQTRIDIGSDGSDASTQATLADTVLGALDYTGGAYEVSTGSLEVEADYPTTRAVFQGLSGLGSEYPIVTARYESGLIVQIETSLPEVASEAEQWFTMTYPEVSVIQFLDSTVDMGNGTPSEEALAVLEAIRETGLAETLSVDRFGVDVATDSPSTSLTILDEIGTLADGVGVTFTSPLPLGTSVVASSALTASAGEQRLRVELAAELYEALKDDPTVNSIVVDRLGVEIQTPSELWTDDTAIAPLQDAVADVVERNGLRHHYVNVNNRPVRGYTD